MTVEECYRALGGDYADVLRRFRSEQMIRKFMGKFLEDRTCEQMAQAVERREGEEAFRLAHIVKGICQNMSFNRLYESSAAMTEALRGGWSDAALPLLRQVMEDYQLTVGAIRKLDANP